MEIWRDIPGYEGWYQVSTAGRVRSLDRGYLRTERSGDAPPSTHMVMLRGKLIQPTLYGSAVVTLYRYGTGIKYRVSDIVAFTFLQDWFPGEGVEKVEYVDGDIRNCALYNLRITRSGTRSSIVITNIKSADGSKIEISAENTSIESL